MIFSSEVPAGGKGTTIVDYLAGRFTYHCRGEWQSAVAAGKVTCNGRNARDGDTVAVGDIVAYDAGEFEEPAADLSYRIVFEDEWLLGIDKPGNLLVHRAGKSFRSNLMYQLRYVHKPPYPAAHACHRLDRGTSGVVCVAKCAEVKAALGRQFAEVKVEKTYMAVVRGIPHEQEINLPVGKKKNSSISYKYGVDTDGRESRTRIIASHTVGKQHALVTLRPLTGRTHQLRVHLAAIGTPIVGDRLYGLSEEAYLAWRGNPSESSRAAGFHRQALHCASLSFVHPVTKKECRIEAGLPADMRELIERLSG